MVPHARHALACHRDAEKLRWNRSASLPHRVDKLKRIEHDTRW